MKSVKLFKKLTRVVDKMIDEAVKEKEIRRIQINELQGEVIEIEKAKKFADKIKMMYE